MGKKALDAARISGYAMDPNDLTVIGIDTEHKRGEHPLWDERSFYALDEGMVLNIMRLGVKETVIVTKDGDNVLVVDGRRRTLHAREANRRLREAGETQVTVPVMLERGSDAHLEEIAISLNTHRLQDSYMVNVDKAVRMLSRNNDEAVAALSFGVDVQTIVNWQKLAGVSKKVRAAIDQGIVAPTAAVKLADLSKDEQDAELEKLIAAGPVTVATATVAAKRAKRVKKNGHADDVLVAPSKKILKKVVEFAESDATALPEDFVRGVRWVIGDLSPTTIKGLSGMINDIEEKKRKAKEKATAKKNKEK